jgi:hypothetical protein
MLLNTYLATVKPFSILNFGSFSIYFLLTIVSKFFILAYLTILVTLKPFKMFNFGYCGGNIIIFIAPFNNFFGTVDTYYCHKNIWG